MGRVDEAMRRAADAADEQAPGEPTDATPSPAGDQVELLAREPYPIEIGERRRLRAPVLPPSAPAPEPKASPAESVAVPPSKSLFERIDAGLARKIVVDQGMAPTSREQYRRLAATLHQSQMSTGARVIMVASAVSNEGKTLTA